MASEQQTDNQIKTTLADKINLGQLSLALLTLVLAIFGYLINSNVQKIQSQSHGYNMAKNHYSFWENMESLENKTFKLSSDLGSDSGKVLVALFKFFENLPNSSPASDLEKDYFIQSNPKLSAAWLEYVSAHSKFVTTVEEISIFYDNSILKHSYLIAELDVIKWPSYAKQQNEMFKWKKDILTPYYEAFKICNDIVNKKHIPTDVASKAINLSRELGSTQVKLEPPFLKGLTLMKSANIEEHLKSI